MTAILSPKIMPILLLLASNVFMTFAWYGHLKFKSAPLTPRCCSPGGSRSSNTGWPCRRIASATRVYSAAELKTIQEVITLVVFVVFSVFYFKEGITWNHVIGFAMICGGAALIFRA